MVKEEVGVKVEVDIKRIEVEIIEIMIIENLVNNESHVNQESLVRIEITRITSIAEKTEITGSRGIAITDKIVSIVLNNKELRLYINLKVRIIILMVVCLE